MSQAYQLPMFFSEAHPVKVGQQPETESVRTTLEISGLTCLDWYSSQDRDVSLLKMCVEELAKDISTLFAADWKLRVTKRKHSYILLRWSAHPTPVNEFSLWPTPTNSDDLNRVPSKTPVTNGKGSVRHKNKQGTTSFMRLTQVVKLYPTPTSSDATSGAIMGKDDIFYPTSTGMPRKVNRNGIDGSIGLGRIVKLHEEAKTFGNPEFWEAMMGLPPGWTELPEHSSVSQTTLAYRNMLMNRRERSQKKRHTTKSVSQRAVMRSCGNKRIH